MGTKATILVVDDEQVIRDLLRRCLEGNGYNVLLAPNGSEGLSIFQEKREEINLIILDMLMPGGRGGDEVLAQIRKTSQVKVLICSGFFAPDKMEILRKLGIAGIIKKPCLPKEFMKEVEEALQQP
ncbi:response regulator [Candidatus Falkowbacteria bacterium CG10_big_fil_rev_8_21_14_0_10_44_15]|uniref:Response regulator n=1 Tax=Candidatus Falkowbacteria bacterium CG10_big_fil_rev_8_21_14_0_10_44_15 TaxID=1974569 RepID=A0A2H0UYT1_9BACT|nr:MAG: response regulator [Candidatus Falkowbacteria bacterium CG10_big_fil_rev_8_21_14_0_10_44_15]